MCAHLSDKDGAFVVISTADLARLVSTQVAKPYYLARSMLSLEVEHKFIIAGMFRFANLLKKHGFKKWGLEVSGYASECCCLPSRSLCKLGFTIKTHKPLGKVVPRMIHSSVAHSFNALGEVINRMFNHILKLKPCICFSSEDVQRAISKSKITKNSILLKYDVEEFYLSGAHSDLANAVAFHMEDPLKQLVHDMVVFVLSYQFVLFDDEQNSMLQVVLGSGMGMRQSGAVSDLSFNTVGEQWLHDAALVKSLGVLLYVKYRDDIMVVLEKPSCCPKFHSMLVSSAAHVYRVEREDYSLVSVNMLDMMVLKHTDEFERVYLKFRPFIKPHCSTCAPWSAQRTSQEHPSSLAQG